MEFALGSSGGRRLAAPPDFVRDPAIPSSGAKTMTDNTGGQILERNNLRNEDNSNDSISRFVSEINMSPMKVELEPPQKRSESRDAVDAKATEQTERQMEYFFKMPGNNSPYIYV